MRQIGHLDTDTDARTFCDFLYVQGIENEAERDSSQWVIWVRSDDDLSKARELLGEFRINPRDPKFMAGSPAAKLREQEKKQQAAYEKRVIEAKALFPGLRQYGFGVVTYALIAACIVVFLISHMGDNIERVSGLLFSLYHGMPEIRSGQIWRLVTPVLIHFGFAHILFNMLWLRDLGSMFEARLSSGYFAVFVVVVAAVSNLTEYIVSKHTFGGMSGVVYGLIGYIWIRGRLDPGAGLQLDRQSVVFALVWFGVCFTGWVGPIANGAHAGGLILGVAWAFVDSKLKRH